MLVSDYDHRPKFSCLIPDGVMGFPIDLTNELQVPVITFHVVSAITLWFSLCIPELIASGKFPFVVIYVSFGSVSLLNEDEFLELWHSLVESGNRFLWVLRPDLVTRANWGDQLPSELIEEVKGRVCVVQWAPQKDVMTHPAIGSFMMQLGWNSTFETITAGVPVIGWPYLIDQYLNGRYFTEKFKIEMVLKDYATDRHTVAMMVNKVMDKRKDEDTTAARLMATMANKAVNEGGSSYNGFSSLADHIRLIGLKVPAYP
ncbi:hypothetical protein Ancab_038697 [Ancistrocladus abbreviatus]